jgi:phage host-nuclease inhibitor protein Gam
MTLNKMLRLVYKMQKKVWEIKSKYTKLKEENCYYCEILKDIYEFCKAHQTEECNKLQDILEKIVELIEDEKQDV